MAASVYGGAAHGKLQSGPLRPTCRGRRVAEPRLRHRKHVRDCGMVIGLQNVNAERVPGEHSPGEEPWVLLQVGVEPSRPGCRPLTHRSPSISISVRYARHPTRPPHNWAACVRFLRCPGARCQSVVLGGAAQPLRAVLWRRFAHAKSPCATQVAAVSYNFEVPHLTGDFTSSCPDPGTMCPASRGRWSVLCTTRPVAGASR